MTTNPHVDLAVNWATRRRLQELYPCIMQYLKHDRPPASPRSIVQYRAAWNRMQTRALWPEEIGAKSRRSFNLYRAAIVHCVSEELRETYLRLCLKSLDQIQRARVLMDKIENWLAILRRYPPGFRDGKSLWRRPERGHVRKSKRPGLSQLPRDWRQKKAEYCSAKSIYADPIIVLILTGARPRELEMGVTVHVTTTGIRIDIRGAKLTATSGQPLRKLSFKNDNWMVQRLRTKAIAAGSAGVQISIKSARALCTFVRHLSRHLFPTSKYIVSPYSFRHAFASDRKAEGVSVEELAEMLGHTSARSQRAYGVALQGKHPCAKVLEVSADRAIVRLDEPRWWQPQAQDPQTSYTHCPG